MRVLIVEDGGFITDALLSLLGLLPELTVVGTVTNASEAIEAACRTHPDLVILDMRIGEAPGEGLPGEKHGLTTLHSLQAMNPAPRVLVFSSLSEHPWLHIIAEAGALGFVHKDEFICSTDYSNSIAPVWRCCVYIIATASVAAAAPHPLKARTRGALAA